MYLIVREAPSTDATFLAMVAMTGKMGNKIIKEKSTFKLLYEDSIFQKVSGKCGFLSMREPFPINYSDVELGQKFLKW